MQKYSWYKQKDSLSSPDTLHQILAFGSLKDILSARKKVGIQKMRQLFLQKPKKVYTKSGLHFITKFILGFNTPIEEKKLLKDAPRYTR